MNSHEVFIHIHQGCFAGTGAILRLPQCQWSKPDGYGKISQCITTIKHRKAKTVCIFLGIYCTTKDNNGIKIRDPNKAISISYRMHTVAPCNLYPFAFSVFYQALFPLDAFTQPKHVTSKISPWFDALKWYSTCLSTYVCTLFSVILPHKWYIYVLSV